VTEIPSVENVHKPAHWSRGRVVCSACRVRWPCLAAVEIAARLAKERAAGDERVLPWWYIPIIAKSEPQQP